MLDFLRRLVEIDSNSADKKGYEECATLIAEEARKLGFGAKIVDGEAKDGLPRPNVIIDPGFEGEKTLVICTHFDIVPAGEGWSKPPFSLTVEGDKAYGRGANDDKGSIAAALYALKEVEEPKVKVMLLCTCDEEVGGAHGAGYLVEKGYAQCDAALIIDGFLKPETAICGITNGRIRIKGKGGHAARPFLSRNPIDMVVPLLQKLQEYKEERKKVISSFYSVDRKQLFGRFTTTILKAGEQENVIPEIAEVGFDLRTNPDENHKEVLREFEEFFKECRISLRLDAELRILHSTPPCSSEGLFVEVVKSFLGTKENYSSWGGTDGRFFSGTPTINFGPSRVEGNAHAPDEFVYLGDLEFIKEKTKQIIEKGW